ncbi:hypothetical protein FB645_001726 [Coemansia sp. IMI 203386]|nr:hypothetical protein FB645_001726 [Coemansia sp. IMI 203386]
MPDIPAQGDEKPNRPSSSLRGGTLRGRGRGRGRGLPAPTNTSTGIPSERLTSIRNRPTGSSGPSTPSTATPAGSKLVFKPTVPARRNKKEPSALLSTAVEVKKEREWKKPERGRGRGTMGRGKPTLIESVSGPFAQGPALISNTGRRGMTGGGGIGPLPSSTDVGKKEEGKPDDVELVMVTDHNLLDNGVVEVQTEEMAIKAEEEMSKLVLDFGVAEVFGGCRKTAMGEMDTGLDDKTMVFQIPQLPEFELAPEVVQRRLAAKVKKQEKQSENPVDLEADVKPGIVKLEANVDVKPDIGQLEAIGDDVKPDLSQLAIHDNNDDSNREIELSDSDAENNEQADGRIGTLVVLRSGAVRMRIGDIVMDVSRGADCQFMRGLLAIDQRDPHSAFLLGNVDQQFLCTPDLDSIPDLEQK